MAVIRGWHLDLAMGDGGYAVAAKEVKADGRWQMSSQSRDHDLPVTRPRDRRPPLIGRKGNLRESSDRRCRPPVAVVSVSVSFSLAASDSLGASLGLSGASTPSTLPQPTPSTLPIFR